MSSINCEAGWYCDQDPCVKESFTTLPTTDAQRPTIYALSTPPGKGGVAIVRVSGPDALLVWKRMDPTPWKVQRCRIVHPENESLIDDGLAIYFRAPYSYTTKPTLELHIHSGRALISALLSSLSLLPLSALLGGRLDLTQVEGLHDLIEADTEVQRLWALGSAGGETRAEYDSLRRQIIHCLAQVEALIDFGEGEDIEEGVYDQAKAEASLLLSQIQKHLSDNRRGELVPSIVTPIPGTTRDVLELTLDIGGLPVVVADTAGLRKTEDVVEEIGVQRGMEAIKNADISLCVLPLPDVLSTSAQKTRVTIPPSVRSLVTPETYFFLNKSDLVLPSQAILPPEEHWTSDADANADADAVVDLRGRAWFNIDDHCQSQRKIHSPIITRARHRVHLESACKFIEAFLALPPEDVVLAAEELRYAAQAVGRVTGDIGVEDVLDALFKDFCIGK
ncbi:hypothetical protein BDZ97DRAFT_1903766 [Flammula alnicola]|nr:hypothetical protein BDZ97DRAFT_1903766 [Flammula alnicola]